MGFRPSVRGVPASCVCSTLSLLWLSFTSHAHPEPKCPTAALVNSSLNFSNDPKLFLISSAIFPFGSPPPCGLRLFQKKVWLKICAARLKMGPFSVAIMSSIVFFARASLVAAA